METTVLELIFLDNFGSTVKLSIEDPRADLTATEVEQAMNTILTNNIITTSKGSLAEIKGAQIVTRTVNELNF